MPRIPEPTRPIRMRMKMDFGMVLRPIPGSLSINPIPEQIRCWLIQMVMDLMTARKSGNTRRPTRPIRRVTSLSRMILVFLKYGYSRLITPLVTIQLPEPRPKTGTMGNTKSLCRRAGTSSRFTLTNPSSRVSGTRVLTPVLMMLSPGKTPISSILLTMRATLMLSWVRRLQAWWQVQSRRRALPTQKSVGLM